jgi:hypothetical protein
VGWNGTNWAWGTYRPLLYMCVFFPRSISTKFVILSLLFFLGGFVLFSGGGYLLSRFFFVLRCFAIHWMGGARRDVIFFFSVAFRALYDG